MTSQLEASIASSTMARLSNATALHNGSTDIPIIFELPPVETIVGFDDIRHVGGAPVATMLDTDIAEHSVAVNDTLLINGVTYTIRVDKSDGMGLTDFELETA